MNVNTLGCADERAVLLSPLAQTLNLSGCIFFKDVSVLLSNRYRSIYTSARLDVRSVHGELS